MAESNTIRKTFEKGAGIFRLDPIFVPRRFSRSGQRLRLHPHDYYALGTARGSIKERWFSSVVPAMNGELAPEDEGMSYVNPGDPSCDSFLFKHAVQELGGELIGKELYEKYGTWPMYSKFFDYSVPLFFHLHLDFEAAAQVGRLGKPEAYYFPFQLNNYPGEFPHTYFGFDPATTKEQVKERLLAYEAADNRITELSRAYRIELGTGWYTPPGVLHAPGSYVTYELQWNSDVNSVYENIVDSEVYPYDFLVENCPADKKRSIEYIMSLMDWEKNTDPNYKKKYFRPPVICRSDDLHVEKWISYGNEYVAGKELTVYPGRSVVIKDKTAYGCVLIQGHGKFGSFDAEAAGMLRFGRPSGDEYFVSEQAAQGGVTIVNESSFEPLVILKHFAANNPATPRGPADE
ncbi:MAG TPA: hypothetical protein GX528_06185 [Firmicutes bacterium]|nr:hypothetical protein [Bacillota bacterium]